MRIIPGKYSFIFFPAILTLLHSDFLSFLEWTYKQFVSVPQNFQNSVWNVHNSCLFWFRHFSAKFCTSEFRMLLFSKTKVRLCIFAESVGLMIIRLLNYLAFLKCINTFANHGKYVWFAKSSSIRIWVW